MFEFLSNFPLPFWVTLILIGGGCVWAWHCMRDGSGIPMLAVLGTVTFWYVGDAYYNDYAENHANMFEATVLRGAWWQVVLFLVVFLAATPGIHRWVNRTSLPGGSGVVQLFNHGVDQTGFQQQLNLLFKGSVIIWITLTLIAAIRLRDQLPYYFFPFLGYKAEPWGRGRIGSGFDALLSVAFYFQLLVTGVFGVVAALATERRTRAFALGCCLLAWPYFIFDRTRNTMLAAVIPGVLSWGLLRVRGTVWKKGGVLALCFVVINAWMAFVIANRGDIGILAALKEKGFTLSNKEKTRHEGLNMFEELSWINTFLERGSYAPNWGARYFAEAVNIIPRSVWSGKPLIGIDYAIARGQGGGEAAGAGVYATISTGLIGQGVVNFGRFLGPAAAALLMSFWVAALGRLDLHIQKLGRIPLYACGLILTFNLGRDITLITLYPFVFGAIAVWWFDRAHSRTSTEIVPPDRRAMIRPNGRNLPKPWPGLTPQCWSMPTPPPRLASVFPSLKTRSPDASFGRAVASNSSPAMMSPDAEIPAQKNTPPQVAVLFHRFGPYHYARLKAAGSVLQITAIEFSNVDPTYAWDPVLGAENFDRLTLFSGEQIHALPSRRLLDRVYEVLDKLSPQVIAIPGWADRCSLAALSWCRARGVPAVLMSETTSWDETRKWWKEALKRQVVGLFSAALVGGRAHADYLVQLGLKRDRIFFGYDAVDNAYFTNQATAARDTQSTVRSRLGLPENFFLASARFVPKKNLSRLLEAYACYRKLAAKSEIGNRKSEIWSLVLLGDGPLRSSLNSQLATRNLQSHVLLPGFKQYNELPDYYGLASVFIHASTTEQWGLVVNEAMASGLPVLVSNRCGCAQDLVQEHVNGFTFDPHNVEELARLMFQLSVLPQVHLASETTPSSALKMQPVIPRIQMGAASLQMIKAHDAPAFGIGLHQAVEAALRDTGVKANRMDPLWLSALVQVLPNRTATEVPIL